MRWGYPPRRLQNITVRRMAAMPPDLQPKQPHAPQTLQPQRYASPAPGPLSMFTPVECVGPSVGFAVGRHSLPCTHPEQADLLPLTSFHRRLVGVASHERGAPCHVSAMAADGFALGR